MSNLIESLEERLASQLEEKLLKRLEDRIVARLLGEPTAAAKVAAKPTPSPRRATGKAKSAPDERDIRNGVGRPRAEEVGPDDLRKCPVCGKTKPVGEGFGFRTVKLVDGPVQRPISWCRSCRAKPPHHAVK